MANDIKGIAGAPINHSELAAGTKSPGRNNGVEAPSALPGGNDAVILTKTAASLREIESSLSEVPVIDTQRVTELRQAIAEGRYQVDPARVAEKLLLHENQVHGPEGKRN